LQIEDFNKLIKWSKTHYHHLPWREMRSVYGTLVSEIMLQQTTVNTVVNHFEKFLEKYPNIDSLSEISEEQIVIDWKGLGYYRRARNLLKAAKTIKNDFDGVIPKSYPELISIHGIGDYTANAILAMGENKPALAVDANLERVLARYYGLKSIKGIHLQKEIRALFSEEKICPEIKSIGGRAFNEALMDLGRSFCKARSTHCDLCPLNQSCYSVLNKTQSTIPLEPEKKQKNSGVELNLLRVIVENPENQILAYKKSKDEWLSGQYEIPSFVLSSADEGLTQYPELREELELMLLPSYTTAITKYKIKNHLLYASLSDLKELGINSSEFVWIDRESNLSTASSKALNLLK
jgi:A/G-specific adenine glycosylase